MHQMLGQTEPHDPLASGLASLLLLRSRLDESLPQSDAFQEYAGSSNIMTSHTNDNRDFALDLFWHHLFPPRRSYTEQPLPKVILNTNTRQQICEIIFRLTQNDQRKFNRLLETLNELVPFYYQDEGVFYHSGARSFSITDA